MASLRTFSSFVVKRAVSAGCRCQSTVSGTKAPTRRRRTPTKQAKSKFTTASEHKFNPVLVYQNLTQSQNATPASSESQNSTGTNDVKLTSSPVTDKFTNPLRDNEANLVECALANLMGGLNADPGMFSAECDVLRKTGFQNQFNQLLDGVDVKSKVCDHLSRLHHSESTILASGSSEDAMCQFLLHLPARDHVFVDANLAESHKLGDLAGIQRVTFENLDDLKSKLSTALSPGRRFILAKLTADGDAMQTLLELADDKDAMVVACDPDGVTHVQNTTGSNGDAQVHEPLITFSSFNNALLGHLPMCYICGPLVFTQWLENHFTESQTLISSYLVAKADHVLSRPDGLPNNLCQTLLAHADLKEQVTETGLDISQDGWSLFIGLKEDQQMKSAQKILIREGFQVVRVNQSGRSGLLIAVPPCHTTDDALGLTETIAKACRRDPIMTSSRVTLANSHVMLEDVMEKWDEDCGVVDFIQSESDNPCFPIV